jgi:hypothetical protein
MRFLADLGALLNFAARVHISCHKGYDGMELSEHRLGVWETGMGNLLLNLRISYL